LILEWLETFYYIFFTEKRIHGTVMNRGTKGALNAPTESGRIRLAWAKPKG
jgi:hypothetical protein